MITRALAGSALLVSLLVTSALAGPPAAISPPAVAAAAAPNLTAAPSPAASDAITCYSGATPYKCTSSQIASFAGSATASAVAISQAMAVQNGSKTASAVIDGNGDSILAGYNAGGHNAFNEMTFGSNVTLINRAISGQSQVGTCQAITQNGAIDGDYSTSKPSIAVMQSATNDLGNNGMSASPLYTNTTTPCIAYMKQKGFYTVLATVLPRVNGAYGWTSAQESQRLAYNAAVRQNTAGADLILDLASDPLLGDGTGAFSNATYSLDGLHPSGLAQDYLSVVYQRALLPLTYNAVRSKTSALAITGTAPAGTVGTAYNFAPSVSGGTSPYNVVLGSGALPAGLSLSSTTGVVSGTPTTAATYTFTETVTDSASTPASVTSASQSVVVAASGSTGATSGTAAYALDFVGATDSRYNATTPTYGTAKYSQGLIGAAGSPILPTGVFDPSSNTYPRTIEVTFSTTDTGQDVVLGQFQNFYISVHGGNLEAGGGSTLDTTKNYADGGFHNLKVVIFDDTHARIYADGKFIASSSFGSILSNGYKMQFRGYGNGFYFNGITDEIAVFSNDQCSASTTTCAVATAPYTSSTTNLITAYHLDGDGSSVK